MVYHVSLLGFFAKLVIVCAMAPSVAMAAPVCKPNDFWADCAKKIKRTIKETNDKKVVMEAAIEWSQRFTALYYANPRSTWTPSDNDRFEQGMEKMWDATIGQYLDPAELALDQMLERFFPRLSAALGIMGGATATAFMNLLAPSPIANSFTQAIPDNKEIVDLVMQKLKSQQSIRQRFPELFKQGFQNSKGAGKTLP